MKLGLQLGYWGAQPPDNHAELVATAEEVGFDAIAIVALAGVNVSVEAASGRAEVEAIAREV